MSIDVISLGVQWDRLISIADEILNSLVRSSFSTNVRESYDLSCVVFDSQGRSIAQGTYSVPSFTGTAPATLAAMLAKFPANTLRPGDVVMTNDPWIGTGHLFDINVMQPVFRDLRIVGYSMSITHLPDIGGAGFSATAREVYEEGLRLPVCMLANEGKLNETLIELIRQNVRVPEQTLGDLLANRSPRVCSGTRTFWRINSISVSLSLPSLASMHTGSRSPSSYTSLAVAEKPAPPMSGRCVMLME